MDPLGINPTFWKNRRVFITGHTGFKGAWLAIWLHRLGCRVTGYALEPPTTPSLYETTQVAGLLEADHRKDILDGDQLNKAMSQAQPEIVFHLAAQSMVREGYRQPVSTFDTNIMGTAKVLEAARSVNSLKAILVITTDKCYENREWIHPYRENDPLGGADPYSSSKACAELVTSSYRSSFFSNGAHPASLATARAGNVIGGGDWAKDRLIPDCIRAFQDGEPVELRYPGATRPWQHVLEPLLGYLLLAERLSGETAQDFANSWNFGPNAVGEASVQHVATSIAKYWGAKAEIKTGLQETSFHESSMLRLDSTKARSLLSWLPRWSLPVALQATTDWYKAFDEGEDMASFTGAQIDQYEEIGS